MLLLGICKLKWLLRKTICTCFSSFFFFFLSMHTSHPEMPFTGICSRARRARWSMSWDIQLSITNRKSWKQTICSPTDTLLNLVCRHYDNVSSSPAATPPKNKVQENVALLNEHRWTQNVILGHFCAQNFAVLLQFISKKAISHCRGL